MQHIKNCNVKSLNRLLHENFNDEYHWNGNEPKVEVSFTSDNDKSEMLVIAVKNKVTADNGIMVKPCNGVKLMEVGYASLADGDISLIVSCLPK